MIVYRKILTASAAVILLVTVVSAQESPVPRSSLTVTAVASGERVRIAAPPTVVQMRIEIYAANGERLFDNEVRGGNVFDWHLQDGQAQRVAAGDYVCVVTVKNVAGKLTQKIGSLRVGDKNVSVGIQESQQLSTQQLQVIGPMEDNSSWTIPSDSGNQTPTVIAHDGNDGQIIRGRGALSFRLGNFFSGVDQEQMRLTEEGNLGIGTSEPKARLDVAGTIRAERVLIAKPRQTGTNSQAAANDTAQTTDGVQPLASGTGTQNKIAKWIDNAGTLGDSIALDTGTGLQLTAAPSLLADTNLLYLNSTAGTTGVLAGNIPSYGANNGPFFAMRGNNYTTIANQRGLFTISAGNVSNPQGDDGSVKFNTGNDQLGMVIRPNGNVGIGTGAPGTRLHVLSAQNPALTLETNSSSFAETQYVAGNYTWRTGVGGSSVINGAANKYYIYDINAGQFRMAIDTTGNVGIGTTSPEQSLHVNGQVLSTGPQAGFKFRDPDSGEDWTWHASLNNLVTNARLTFNGHEVIRVIPNDDSLGNGLVIVDYLEVQKLNPGGNTSICLDSGGIVAHCSSSLRYKTNIAPFSSGLNFIRQLRPISFDWKAGGMHDVGFGAEDVARINPLFVTYNKEGQVEGVKYDRLSTVFVNAFKEQQTEIEKEQDAIRQQQTQIDSLKKLICADHPNAHACKSKN